MFRTKLFALAKEDEDIKTLWYAEGKKVRDQHPTMETKELLPLIVDAVWAKAMRDKPLYDKARDPTTTEAVETIS